MSGVDDRAGAVDGPATAPEAGELPVAPVLVRDYRRLLRLFPYTYRREHEAEMLGHLLDGAAPGQARPSRAERWDLLRAAAREWLFAPLGSTARQRRDGSGVLLVVLMLLLAVQAARELSATMLFLGNESRHEALGIAGEPLWIGVNALISAPLAPAWLAWGLCVGSLAVGLSRTGAALAVVAAVAGAFAVGGLVVAERTYLAYVTAGWVLALAAFALVVGDRARLEVRVMTLRAVTVTVFSAAVAVGLHALAAPTGDSLWASSILVGNVSWTLPGLLRPAFVVLGAMLLWERTRQSVPALTGVATALFLGREPFFWSEGLWIEPVHLGDVLALLGVSLAATAATRWVVNRLGELKAPGPRTAPFSPRRAASPGLASHAPASRPPSEAAPSGTPRAGGPPASGCRSPSTTTVLAHENGVGVVIRRITTPTPCSAARGPAVRQVVRHEALGEARVGRGGEVGEALGDVVGQAEAGDELPQPHSVDPLPARELLEALVRVLHAGHARHGGGAHRGLDGLAEHLPVLVEVGRHEVGVRGEGGEAAAHVVDREQRVAERGADVALRRRVGEVALEARGDERRAERVEERARDLEVRLGVLEADRVDLVRHGRRPRRAGTGICVKKPSEMYVHTSVARLCSTRLNRATSA
ncbi:hypothetical protein BJF88_08565 [Cellulosimicrobium sp. CUA-896]|nr:hypothetical protein BJF88_08565 [Cellulosimicrobium sp. CUA-896]